MNETTELKIRCITLEVERRRIAGEIHLHAEVTPRRMEKIGQEIGVLISHKTIRNYVTTTTARLKKKLSNHGIKAEALRLYLASKP